MPGPTEALKMSPELDPSTLREIIDKHNMMEVFAANCCGACGAACVVDRYLVSIGQPYMQRCSLCKVLASPTIWRDLPLGGEEEMSDV